MRALSIWGVTTIALAPKYGWAFQSIPLAISTTSHKVSFSTCTRFESRWKDVEPYLFNDTVTILEEGKHHVVVSKPPSVVCHHSQWSWSRSSKRQVPEVPMLQRTREAIGERVNLVHRLDRGASGCLLFAKTASDDDGLGATSTLHQAMAENATKTYIALVRGEGILKGRDFQEEGWFTVDRPIKDENGKLKDAVTNFRFIAGQDNEAGAIDRPRASLVLARPETGRWHQIRRHLNGLSHPILGDTSHGDNRVNREWRDRRDMLPERTCLHLVSLEIPPNPISPDGISVTSPLASDMMSMLENYLPNLLEASKGALLEEGISFESQDERMSTVQIQLEI